MSILAGYLMPHAPVFIDEIGGTQIKDVHKTIEALNAVSEDIQKLEPDTVIVISPHGPIFSDAVAVYDLKNYQGHFHTFGEYTLSYTFEKDEVLCNQLIEASRMNDGVFYPLNEKEFRRFQFSPMLDHGVTVPLHFISRRLKSFKVLAMSYGALSYAELLKQGEIIKQVVEASGKNVVIVASGDMSHALKNDGPYAYHPDGPWFDDTMSELIENQKPYDIFSMPPNKIENASECGLRSFAIMMGAFNKMNITSNVLNYEGPFGVGYLVAKIGLKDHSEVPDQIERINTAWRESSKRSQLDAHPFVQIATAVIRHYTAHKYSPKITLSEEAVIVESQSIQIDSSLRNKLLNLQRGTFVSIKKMGALRGCIGTIMPRKKDLLTEIVSNAISACSKDYRFDPIEPGELAYLTVSVDILSELEEVSERSSLNPRDYGVIVHSMGKMGVLLPDLDGVDTVEEQLKIASNKAGFKSEEIELVERFSVERYI